MNFRVCLQGASEEQVSQIERTIKKNIYIWHLNFYQKH